MTKRYDFCVMIGRFQPLHIGHAEVIQKATEIAEQVIVLVGSANQPRTIKNPFTVIERAGLIQSEFPTVHVRPISDHPYNNQAWAQNVQNAVSSVLGWSDRPQRGCIIGHKKDESSFYLDLFPQWDLVDHAINETVDATDIRKMFFTSNIKYIEGVVSENTFNFLQSFKKLDEYQSLVREFKFIQDYKKGWEAAPYPPTFVTGDAVVIQSGHVLVVTRGAEPGRGLLALPGGFINQKETVEDCIVRELREETRLKVPAPVLKGSIKRIQVFDAPDRSQRGRTIAHAALIELPAGRLPAVKGGDDAAKAQWLPLNFVREEEFFEDHVHIIDQLVGGVLK